MRLIEIDHLRLSLGGTEVLRDVSLRVGAGEIIGLLGPNGAGKTTTILAALGLYRPQAGRVRLFGEDPAEAGATLRRRVGVLPDPNGFHDWMDAEAYLGFFARLNEVSAKPAAMRPLLDLVGLAPRPRQRIGSFSRGMRQRLGLARALVAAPDLLVLDEPTSGLDPQGRRQIHDVLAALARRGAGILLCTHLLDDVERLCHGLCILSGGRSVASGALAALLRAPGRRRRFRLELSSSPPALAGGELVTLIGQGEGWAKVEMDPSTPPDAAWRSLFAAGWPIVAIAHEDGGLETLYLEAVRGGAADPLRDAA